MEKQIKWLYCEKSTKNHPIAINHNSCLQKLADIAVNEGGSKKNPFTKEIVINLDKVEVEKASFDKRDLRNTVDIAFCIKNSNQKNIVLIEFRLNYENIKNLGRTELDQKIKYSKELLSSTVQIHNLYYFVFKTNIKNQAYRRIRSLYSNKSNHIAIDIDELNTIFFK